MNISKGGFTLSQMANAACNEGKSSSTCFTDHPMNSHALRQLNEVKPGSSNIGKFFRLPQHRDEQAYPVTAVFRA